MLPKHGQTVLLSSSSSVCLCTLRLDLKSCCQFAMQTVAVISVAVARSHARTALIVSPFPTACLLLLIICSCSVCVMRWLKRFTYHHRHLLSGGGGEVVGGDDLQDSSCSLRFLVAKQSASVLCEGGRPRVLCLPFFQLSTLKFCRRQTVGFYLSSLKLNFEIIQCLIFFSSLQLLISPNFLRELFAPMESAKADCPRGNLPPPLSPLLPD